MNVHQSVPMGFNNHSEGEDVYDRESRSQPLAPVQDIRSCDFPLIIWQPQSGHFLQVWEPLRSSVPDSTNRVEPVDLQSSPDTTECVPTPTMTDCHGGTPHGSTEEPLHVGYHQVQSSSTTNGYHPVGKGCYRIVTQRDVLALCNLPRQLPIV